MLNDLLLLEAQYYNLCVMCVQKVCKRMCLNVMECLTLSLYNIDKLSKQNFRILRIFWPKKWGRPDAQTSPGITPLQSRQEVTKLNVSFTKPKC